MTHTCRDPYETGDQCAGQHMMYNARHKTLVSSKRFTLHLSSVAVIGTERAGDSLCKGVEANMDCGGCCGMFQTDCSTWSRPSLVT